MNVQAAELNGGYTFYKNIATNVCIAIAYYNNIMYKAKKLVTYVPMLYIMYTAINISSYIAIYEKMQVAI